MIDPAGFVHALIEATREVSQPVHVVGRAASAAANAERAGHVLGAAAIALLLPAARLRASPDP